MPELSKVALQVDSNQSFPNNNNGYITPAGLRTYNTNVIDSTVNQIQYTADSGSWNSKIGILNGQTGSYATTGSNTVRGNQIITGSFNISGSVTASFFKGDGSGLTNVLSGENPNLNAFTQSQDTKNLTLATYTGSVDTQFIGIGSSTASLNAFTQSQNTKDGTLASYTGSNDTKWSTIAAYTASFSASDALFNAYTQSTDTKFSTLGTYTSSVDIKFIGVGSSTASLNTFTSSQESKDITLGTYTGSNDTKWSTIGVLTGSYATTGSNTFTGAQTLNGNNNVVSGSIAFNGTAQFNNTASLFNSVRLSNSINGQTNHLLIDVASGSIVLQTPTAAQGLSALGHLSASSNNSLINLVFKNNTNTGDTLISGSNNIFVNPAAPAAGFKRYVGGSGNIMLNASNVPQITGSMGFSPVMNNNYFGGNSTTLTMRGPISSSTYTISGNQIVGPVNIGQSAAITAEKLTSGLTMTGNSIGGTLNINANQTALTGSATQFSNNILNGTATLNLSSSAAVVSNNTINDTAFTLTNGFFSGSVGIGLPVINRNTIGGASNGIIITGGQPATTTGFGQPQISSNILLGRSNILFVDAGSARVSGSLAYQEASSNAILGNTLIVSGSSLVNDLSSHGSVFVGRFNADDSIRNKTSDIVFGVGTGNTTTKKTGFHIDSGSNTFVEGTLNVSGGVFQNVVPITIASSTASLDLRAGTYFTLTLADNTTTHIKPTNLGVGVSATLVITTGTNSSASLAPILLQPSGLQYTASLGSSKIDVLSLVGTNTNNMFVVSTKNLV